MDKSQQQPPPSHWPPLPPRDLDEAWARFEERFEIYFASLPCGRIIDKLVNGGMDGCPNILFYSAGFPSQLVYNIFLQKMFNNGQPLALHSKTWDKDLMYTESLHHFEIDLAIPTQCKSLDKLACFIREVVTHKCIHNNRHVMVFANIEHLTKAGEGASQAFRVFLERFSNNVMFICTSDNISGIEKPLISRFMPIRIPLFSVETVRSIIHDVGLPVVPTEGIPSRMSRDLPYCMYVAWLTHIEKPIYRNGQVIRYYFLLDYFGPGCHPTIDQMRSLAQKLHNVDATMSDITLDLMTLCKESYKAKVLELGAKTDHHIAITHGNRKSLYIEHFLNAVNRLDPF